MQEKHLYKLFKMFGKIESIRIYNLKHNVDINVAHVTCIITMD